MSRFELESADMISLKVLSTAAAMALVLPMVAPTASFAQSPGGGRANAQPGGGVRIGGGGGGGGFRAGGGGGAPAARFGGGGGAPGAVTWGGVRVGGGGGGA